MGDMFRLDGKLAVLIGGTSTLGTAIAKGFSQQGARLVLVGRNEKKANQTIAEIKELGTEAKFVAADVREVDSIERVAKEIDLEYGGWDILVNASGVNSSTPFFEITEAEWEDIMDVNLKAVMFACQAFSKRNVNRKKGGSIINISSVSSTTPLSRVSTYSASKAGINNITEFMARELAPYNIRVNALIPGFFPAEQNRKILDEDRVQSIMSHTPMNRFGKPEELQGAAVWLASEKASSFVTGSFVTVDGGFGATKI